MRSDAFNEDYIELLQCFAKENVEYLIVGSYALAVHAEPRATGDIDLFVKASPQNAERIWRALIAFGAPLQAHGIQMSDFMRPNTVYQMGIAPRRIDLLTSISGVTFDEAWGDHFQTTLGGQPVSVLSKRALIQNKRASARLKDLADLEMLEKSNE